MHRNQEHSWIASVIQKNSETIGIDSKCNIKRGTSMVWNTFEQNKHRLARQYKENRWSNQNAMPLPELQVACEEIVAKDGQMPRMLIKAELLSFILRNAQIEVNPLEWFADKINHGGIVVNIRTKWKEEVDACEMKQCLSENRAAQEQMVYTGDVDFSHTSPDWDAIMELGIPGLLARVREERDKKLAHGNMTEEQAQYYSACETVYEAVIDYIKRLAAEAVRLSQEHEKMALVAENLSLLAERAPQTLPEAMQLTFLFYYLQTYVEGENVRSLGGLDQLYYRFYKADLELGRYSEDQIRELIQYYLYKFYALEAIANTPFYLAGVDSEGKGITNELSYLLLDVYDELNIHDPKLHIRCYQGIPDDFLKKALEMIRNGNSSIVFMNDEVVIQSLINLGQKPEEARHYAPIGCYEPSSLGKELPCTSNARINVTKAVELAVNDGRDLLTGTKYWDIDEAAPEDFEGFYAAVKAHLAKAVAHTMDIVNRYEKCYGKIIHAPLFSATMQESVEQGKDLYLGGAKYNNSSINIVSIADAIDSIVAVKKAVYEEKLVTLAQLAEILRNNWVGYEDLQRRCKGVYPKYGNNCEEVDSILVDLTGYLCGLINNKPNGRNGVYRCGFFSIDGYIALGAKAGAAPNGRLARVPLSKNVCAAEGQDKNGVTDLIHTVTKIDFTQIPNGTALDLMLHTSAVQGEEGLSAMLGLLKVFLLQGGIGVQINVLSPDVLKKAQQDPEHYSTLQIRLCGWNVYFVNLSRLEQDEFIRRAEHSEVTA